MKKFLVLIPGFFLATAPFGQAFAQVTNDPGKDFGAYKNYMMDHYRSLENGDPSTANPAAFNRSGGFRGVSGKSNYSKIYDYKTGDSLNYMKDQIIQKIGTLAQALAGTAGSAFAFDSSNQLRAQATQLSATGDPNFQQVASLLNQEATAVDQGDRAQAQSLAGQIAPMATLPVSANYQPTPQQDQFLAALGNAFTTVVTSLTSILGAGLVGQLVSSLLGPSSYSGVLGSGMSGLLNSQSPSNVAKNTSVGVVNVAGGQAVGSLNQSMNVGSSLQPVPQGANNGQAVPKP